MDTCNFLVAGGGIAGLAAALGLARAGRAAEVYEQAPRFEEVGAGLQMSPNAVRALQYLGAWDAVAPTCVIPRAIEIRDGAGGGLLQRVGLGPAFEERFGAPYRVVHRADLLGGLLATAQEMPNVALATARKVTTAQTAAGGASLRFADGTMREGAAVIAADGIRSAIRATVFADAEPAFQGHVLYRALIARDQVPPSIDAEVVTLWLCPGAHVVHYAVSAGRAFNIVASIEGQWRDPSWSAPGDAGPLRQAFAEMADPLRDIVAAPAAWLKWMGADRNPRDVWCDGRIALMGDAAHATLPYLAQGAAMSLEDACVLAHAVGTGSELPRALQAYAQARIARTRRIQTQSREQGRLYHARGVTRIARNAALKLMPQAGFLERLRWIYDWAPEA